MLRIPGKGILPHVEAIDLGKITGLALADAGWRWLTLATCGLPLPG
jgi:hypothetical protein